MKPDWRQVTVDHVRQACALYRAGSAMPTRPARNTFLLLDGEIYPGKFIRGLAYQLATGAKLDPSRDYAGGEETARFFANLGLQTVRGRSSTASVASPTTPTGTAPGQMVEQSHRRFEPQKQALFHLLRRWFGEVECEAAFPWLVVPQPTELSEPLSSIFQTLQAMRGFSKFAGAGRPLRCDFCIPSERLIIEYDERQHFTLQRAVALEHYSADLPLGFDRREWIAACNAIQATDPDPPYRDEQRAFYDSVRDIIAGQHGYKLIRFRQGAFDWCGDGGERQLAAAIAASAPNAGFDRQPIESAQDDLRKLALVSHDYSMPDDCGLYDYSEHFAQINHLCGNQGCDTILYALYTWDSTDSTSPVAKTHDALFNGLLHVQRIILEVGRPPDSYDHLEVWVRGHREPIVAHQRFAMSNDAATDKRRFIGDLPNRRLGPALLVICGETNIGSLIRGSDAFYDPFEFASRLREMKIDVILNPIHDYMRRYEMRETRRYYSRDGRTVISVWNRGRGKEAWLPWTIFHDGREETGKVQELQQAVAGRPDIRVGIIDVGEL